MSNVEMMRATCIKTLLASNLDAMNDRVDKVKTELNRKINDLDISVDKHLITTTQNYESLDDKITATLDSSEKTTKKRT